MHDPRIRGVCPDPPYKPDIPVRLAKDRCSGVVQGTGFRCGSIVRIRGTNIQRTVKYINYFNQKPGCDFLPAKAMVMTLDLGGQYTNVPWDAVDLIKI